MLSISVRFDSDQEDSPKFPIAVEQIEKHDFPPETRDGGGDSVPLDITIGETIDEAHVIVGTAPAFDHVDLDRLWESDVTAAVIVSDIQ